MKEKINIIIISVVLLLISSSFYWFAFRPSRIKHDCSWVKVMENAIPAQPAITQSDVAKSKLDYEQCVKENGGEIGLDGALKEYVKTGLFDDLFQEANINACRIKIKTERPAIPEIQEKEWYRQADREEYNFCIHEKGL